MEWHGTGEEDGRITLSRYTKADFREYLRVNGPCRITISHDLPESGKLRRFYHGAVLPLWAFLDGKDHRDSKIIADLHEVAKIEFNGEIITVGGMARKIGRSSKGWQLQEFVERVITYMEENYGIDRAQCLNPDDYKHWRDTVVTTYSVNTDAPDTFIDHLVQMGRLRKPGTIEA
jgi:hypothetical protein